jgi:hypothetical protein
MWFIGLSSRIRGAANFVSGLTIHVKGGGEGMDRVRFVSDVMPVGLTFYVLKRRRGWGGGGDGGDEDGGEGDERDVEREMEMPKKEMPKERYQKNRAGDKEIAAVRLG